MTRLFHSFAAALVIALISCMAIGSRPANATSVTITEYYPDTATVYAGPIGPFTVDFTTAPDPFGLGRPWTFSVNSTAFGYQIVFNPNETLCCYSAGAFNGFAFAFAGAAPITGASNDISSTFPSVGISWTSDTVFLDYQGLGPVNGVSSIVDVTVGAVPEASTWAMMLLGFAALGFMGARQARRRAWAA